MAQLSEEGLRPRRPLHHQERIICFQIKMPSLANLFNAISGLAACRCNAKKTFFLSMASSSGEITMINATGGFTQISGVRHELAAE